ncbi:hypothetical protein AcW1_004808 [Taiwanofungus camphoratus]|nr:hypothetical protein AcW1_004808 [Antrodia cinnamomea]
MHSSLGRSRRQQQQGSGVDEEAPSPLVPRADEPRSESFSHSHRYSHRSESYRPSPPPRTAYNMRQENSSSRHRRDNDDWRAADSSHSSHDRYNYSSKDVYHRGERDDYDPPDAHYNTSRQWPDGYEPGYTASTYPESSSWTPSTRYDRANSYSKWPTEEGLSGQQSEKGRPRYSDDRQDEGWTRDDRRNGSGQDWRRDSSWEPRQAESQAHSWDNSSRRWSGTHVEGSQHAGEDRSWEPSASWQPNSRNGAQGYRHQNSNKSSNQNKSAKSGKKHHNNRQKRDWRQDDGHLNNWTRRDMPQTSNKNNRGTGKRRQQRRSPSRVRSRSPAESYHSRRSSRGRSLSSDAPKRRRKDTTHAGGDRSPSPHDRRGKRNGRQRERYSRSPTSSPRSVRSIDSRGRARRRSLSSVTSTSRSRSRTPSRSPKERPRTVHRLPVATSVNDIALSLTKSPLPAPRIRGQDPYRNGGTNGKQPERARSPSRRETKRDGDNAKTSSAIAMPPPSNLPVSVASSLESPVIMSSSPVETRVKSASSAVPRIISTKNAGFKPIGQPSLAVKRFFPGDDDEENEPVRERRPSTSLPSTSRSHPITSSVPQSNLASQQASIVHEAQCDDNSFRRSPNEIHRPERALSSSDRRAPPDSHLDDPASLMTSPRLQEPSSRATDLDDSRIRRDVKNEYTIAHMRMQDDEQDNITPIVTRPPSPITGSQNEVYELISQVGEGTFGKVFKARNASNGRFVALKKIRMEGEKEGFPVTAMREIKLLQSLRHDNVVRLYEMMVRNNSVYMVFEYMDHDLTGVLSQTQFTFTDAHLKSFCRQMLAGLAYLHHKGVIHRDIKGSNILVNNRGELKLADFGLARFYQKRRKSDYTNRVITLWYRPPELLFGTTVYGPEVDMWSAGCIMLELFTKKPVFQGNDEIHQLDVIYRIVGTPTVERWPGMTSLPWYELIKPKDMIPNHFRELFEKWLSPAGLDLAERLLAYDPAQRVTAVQALEAPYFHREHPTPAAPVGYVALGQV